MLHPDPRPLPTNPQPFPPDPQPLQPDSRPLHPDLRPLHPDPQPLPTDPQPFPPDPRPLHPDPRPLEAQLNFFQKLGYSTAQVQALQRKFGADTDKVLGELVHIGAIREAEQSPVTTMSVLVPRRDSRAVAAELFWVPGGPQSREEPEDRDVLRAVVIDGSNVAMSHGNKEVFSCLGIQLAVNYFLDRGHNEVTVFVPSWRKEQPRPDVPITDQHILRDLEKKKILVFTPSRRVGGRRVVCNDDCFIVKHAFESDGVVVSNDLYRDLQCEKPEWKRFIEERLLMFSFVNNKFMPPDDPLGRHGPTLENFLRRFPKRQKRQACPYGKKCTYGIKCRFHHPERPKLSNRAVADELRQNSMDPPGSQKQALNRDGPVPELSLRLVEDMAQKLTLGHNGISIKKHEAHVKSTHRSGKKTQIKKDKSDPPPERSSLRETSLPSDHSLLNETCPPPGSSLLGKTGPSPDHYLIRETCLPPECSLLRETGPLQDHILIQGSSSPEQLDSGLGSIGSQPTDAAWSLSDQQYKTSCGSNQSQYHPLRSAPCSCCSCVSLMSSHGADLSGYNLFCNPSCYTYPLNRPMHSQPPDFQHRRVHPHKQLPHWSDPFPAGPPKACSPLNEHCKPGPSKKEREVVRKKLLAIFSAQLVDMAMNMFPDLLDPQRLVAEILMLQSQNQSLR